jgi:outer membrane protein OmpA-like peptidoglycan-associated protein
MNGPASGPITKKSKNMIRKILFAIVCFTFAATNAGAQELNVWVDGGPQGLSYKVPNGSHDLLFGGSLGLGYTFPLARHWGIIAGVSGGFYGSRAKLNDGTYSAPQVDNTGSAFRYDIKTNGYTETQRFFSFGVPLMLQYHSTGAGTQWYVNGGGKLLLPLNATVKGSAQGLALSGYYPDYNLEVSNLPEHGFGTVDNWKGRETYKLKTGVALDAEMGVSFALGSRMRLYTGLYLEYGLTDMKGTNDGTSLVSYGTGDLASVKGGSVWNGAAAGDAKLLSYGLQVKLGFGFGHGRSKAKVGPQPASVPVPDTTRTQAVAQQLVVTQPEKPKEQEKPKEPEQPKVAPKPAPGREIETMRQPVVFGVLGKTSLPENVKPHLDEVAQLLNNYPDLRIAIIGHTCSIGTETENKKIGEARARAVADYLQSRGVDAGRMDVRSDGESQPAFPNDSAANRSRNRRVTVLSLVE